MINLERMISHTESLMRIDSESRQERDVALKLKEELESLGAHVHIDDADKKVGGNTGNVIAYVEGNHPNAPPFLLSAHMDTVVPGKGVKLVRQGKVLKTSGDTVLGGDDKSGLSIIMEVLRTLKEKNLPHPNLEIVFTVCEEIGLLGAKALDPKALKSKIGLVLDSEFASILTTQGPAAVRMEVDVHGLEAHAGVAPERGISAIKIVSEAIAKMKLGRIDKETTANIGVIEGGLATNIIPNHVHLKGEARSLNPAKLKTQVAHMKKVFEDAAKKYKLKVGKKTVLGKAKVQITDDYSRLNVSKNSKVVKLAREAAKKLGYTLKEGATGGGSDANVFNKWKIETANLGTGMRDIHTVKEWLDLKDFEQAGNLVAQMLILHAGEALS
jgi:tripeptide aminopeptidase